MGCKPKIPKCRRNKISTIKIVEERKIPSKNLRENGRIQYFYHSPSSKLPIRDVLSEQKVGGEPVGHKTEPHIEIGAENYLSPCRQNNIVAHLNKSEKYLFLVTTYRNKKMDKDKKFKVPYIVGFIDKEECLTIKNKNGNKWKAIKGKTFLFPFDKSIPYYDIFPEGFTPIRCINDENKINKILNHFKKFKKDRNKFLQKCVDKIKELDKNNKTCIGKDCKFYKNGCLRWKK